MATNRPLGLMLVLAAVIAWSTAGLFTLSLHLDAPTVLFWRGVFGALGMILIMPLLPGAGLRSFARLGWIGIGYGAIVGASMLCFISALLLTTVAHVAVATALVPLIAALLGWAVLGSRPAPIALTASLAALAGVAVMVGVGREGRLAGDALALLMALGMAAMILIARRHPHIPALAAMALASALSAVATLPFAQVFGLPLASLGQLAAFAFVNQVFGFGLFALGARHLAPTETALLTTLEAPLAPLWVW
ncbi:MAG: DMT family transporter, partial [Paracoccaceae bacterium]